MWGWNGSGGDSGGLAATAVAGGGIEVNVGPTGIASLGSGNHWSPDKPAFWVALIGVLALLWLLGISFGIR